MIARCRPVLVLAAALAALLAVAPLARANEAFDEVAAAYTRAGGHLDPCAFTQAQLQAADRGMPAAFRTAVPELRRAIEDGVAAHAHGDCKGTRPEEASTGGAAPGAAKTPTTAVAPPVATTPAQTAPAATVPTTTQPAPTTLAPAPTATTPAQPAAGAAREHDRTPLLVALVTLGALVLLGLLLWGLARSRGWQPAWAERMRHGWGEAGFRATSTWSEFTDWLRLGR